MFFITIGYMQESKVTKSERERESVQPFSLREVLKRTMYSPSTLGPWATSKGASPEL
jgi:hypothetical protein